MHRWRPRLRRAAVIQTALFACALLGAWSHHSHERHGYCSDHGEVIHLGEAHLEDQARAGDLALEADQHAHGAHSCAVLTFLAGGAAASAQTDAVGPLTCASAGQAPLSLRFDPAVPLLLQAPKASPPTA